MVSHVLGISKRLLLPALATLMMLCASQASATDYYVSNSGSDMNPGTSSAAPLATIGAVNAKTLVAGDSVNLARGSSFNQALYVSSNENGTALSPILVTAYGSGNDPVISVNNTTSPQAWARGVDVIGDYAIVEHIKVAAASEIGMYAEATADHAIFRNNEITNTGIGVLLKGGNGRATGNYVHDQHMVINNTTNSNDDYGANCFWVESNDNEVDHNTGLNCKASSFDYGTDGGFVEVWAHGDNLKVHHNKMTNTNGMMEMGGPGTGSSAVGIRYHDNVAIDSDGMCLHMTGTFAMTLSDIWVDNNSIYNSATSDKFFQCVSGVNSTKLKFRNNAYKSNVGVITSTNGTPDHVGNVMSTPQAIGFSLAADERSADPLFVSTTDLHLQSTSPAIDLDATTLWTPDFDGNTRPTGSAPDAGAYEYQPPAPPTVTPVDDTNIGTGNNQWQYNPTWTQQFFGGAYGGSIRYSGVVNATATLKFNGTVAKVYVKTGPDQGIAAVTVDGGSATNVDLYSASTTQQVLKFTSATLAAGVHTLVFKNTGTKNASSSSTYVNVDKADVTS